MAKSTRLIIKDGEVNIGLLYINDSLSKKYDAQTLCEYFNTLLIEGVNAELVVESTDNDPISRRLNKVPKNGTSKQSDPF